MRNTVIVSDVMIFFTAVIAFCLTRGGQTSNAIVCVPSSIPLPFFTPIHVLFPSSDLTIRVDTPKIKAVLLILLQPCLIVVDHGHFQYNCIALGLVIWAVVAVQNNNLLASSILFVLSIMYKQMTLYFAPAFFFFTVISLYRSKSSSVIISLDLS